MTSTTMMTRTFALVLSVAALFLTATDAEARLSLKQIVHLPAQVIPTSPFSPTSSMKLHNFGLATSLSPKSGLYGAAAEVRPSRAPQFQDNDLDLPVVSSTRWNPLDSNADSHSGVYNLGLRLTDPEFEFVDKLRLSDEEKKMLQKAAAKLAYEK